jgi:hypothetical protein
MTTCAICDLMLVSMLEIHVGAICASAPVSSALWRYLFRVNSESRSGTPTNPKISKDNIGTRLNLSTRRGFMQCMNVYYPQNSRGRNKHGYHLRSSATPEAHQSPGTRAMKDAHYMSPQSLSLEELSIGGRCYFDSASYDRYSEDTELKCFMLKDRHTVLSTRSLISIEKEISK